MAVPPFIAYAPGSQAYTATGNSGDIQVAGPLIGATDELAFDANVSAVSGTTPSLTLSIQRKGADGNYYTIWTGTALTAAGPQSASIGKGQATNADFDAIVRIVWTISGTTPSFTMTLSLKVK